MRIALVALVAACSGSAPPPKSPPPSPAVVVTAPDPFAAYNLGFEDVDGDQPRAWVIKNGTAATVTEIKHGGGRSLRLDDGRIASTSLPAKDFLGKRVTVRGFIQTKDATFAALWVRADAASEVLAFDNMEPRKLTGTQPWTAVEVAIDVPPTADKILVGAMLYGTGSAWFDDLRIEVGEIKPPAEIELQGIVVDPAGAPAANAEVALISAAGEIEQHVQANAQGRFVLKTREGRWGVSAHHAPAVGAFLPITPYAKTTELELALGKDGGVTVRGKTSQKPTPGTYLRISPVSEFDADLFAVAVAEDGTFSAVLPASTSYFLSEIGGYGQGSFARKGNAATVDGVLETPSLAGPPDDVIAYIGKHAIPLTSVEAGKGFDDVAPVGKLVGKARIVALGEPTHGSREVFQMKHRMLEYLVVKHGFTVFAIEANQPECRAINDYVLHGKGNAKDALAGIYFWTWNTEEVLAMIEWMRAWNADPSHANKVQFTGFDMQVAKVAFANVEAVAGKDAMKPVALLALANPEPEVKKLDEPARKALRDGLASLRPLLAKADPDIRHDLRILEQATDMYMTKSGYDARDLAMAENVGWLLDHTKARIVVWAHNGHISNTLPAFVNMGSHLRKKYKGAYLNLGFLFSEGAFQAYDMTKQPPRLAEVTVGAPPPFLATAPFVKAKMPLAVLELRALPKQGPVAAWFRAPHHVRELGALYTNERQMTYPMVLPAMFDAVIFIERTTRARPVKK